MTSHRGPWGTTHYSPHEPVCPDQKHCQLWEEAVLRPPAGGGKWHPSLVLQAAS